MFNIKWGLIAGITGLALAFLTSLLFARVGLPIALLRALIFAVVFFGLGGGISALINIFIPELLTPGSSGNIADNVFSAEPSDSGSSGSRVNITLDDEAPNAALPDTGTDAPNTEEVGNFNDMLSGSIGSLKDVDQSSATSYTDDEGTEFAPAFESVKLGELGDFSLDFGAFVPSEGSSFGGSGSGPDADPFSFLPETKDSVGLPEESPSSERKYYGNKPMELKGDFDPKEIAAGLRTVLQKDKG